MVRTFIRYLFRRHARNRHSGASIIGSELLEESHMTHLNDRCVRLSEVVMHHNVDKDSKQEEIDYWMDKSIQLETEVSRLKSLIREQGMIKIYRLSYGGAEFVGITTQSLKSKVKAHFQEVLWLRLGNAHNQSSKFGQSHFAAHLVTNCDVALEDVFGLCVYNLKVWGMRRSPRWEQ